MYAIIGSYAICKYIPSFRKGEIKDIDAVYSKQSEVKNIEAEFPEMAYDLNQMPLNLIDSIMENSIENNIPTLNNLYTLKLSHVFWPIHHQKTIRDIIFLQRNGCEVNLELFDSLKKYWKDVHGGKDFLTLNKNKDDFFDDFVKKKVDHDLIHEWVSRYSKPLYTMCLKDGQEVLLSWDKFNKLSHEDRVHMIREEIMTIGIERFAIPKEFDIPSGICYIKALRLVITNLMKGRFANFIAFNLSEIADYKMTKEYFIARDKFKGVVSD